MNKKQISQFLSAVLWSGFIFANAALATEFEFINVGDSDTEIPGGTGTFEFFSLPGISDGWVVYVGGVGGELIGVYRRRISDPASLEVIADTNTPIPGATGTFTGFGLSASMDHGDITFRGTGGPPEAAENGVYTYIGGVLEVVADKNTPVPGGTGTFSDVGVPWICDFEGGTVVFRGHGTDGERGVYTNASGALRVIADLNTLIPEGAGTFTRFQRHATFIRSDIPTMDGGNVAFYGVGTDGQEGVYLEWNGALSKVADLNTLVPGGTGNFLSLGGHLPAHIDGETIVFSSVGEGLYRSVNGVLSLIVDINSPVPSSAPGVAFNTIAPQGFGLSKGAVSFLASTTDSAGGNVYTTLGGSLTKVIAKGDIVDGIARGFFGTYGNGIDGDSIVFNSGIESGGAENHANFVARPVDTTPPDLSLSVSPIMLWPPNHEMIPIDVTATASDNRDPNPTVELILVQSSEADNSDTFDPAFDVTEVVGKKGNDIQIIDGQLFLRAERSGNSDGRVYTITYEATDASGISTTATATVEVPHNQ